MDAPEPTPADPLGPFAPPADYAFEPEFDADVPRPIPLDLRQGRYAAARWRSVYGFLFVGLVCLAADFLPATQAVAVFVPPLGYLEWIGLACLGLGAVGLVRNLAVAGPYRYVTDGVPVVARVRDLVLRPTAIINGTPASYQFAALIEYGGADGSLAAVEASSSEFSADVKDRLTTSFRVGDYVTAIYPPATVGDVKLYAFLDLKPGLGLVPRDGLPPAGPVQVVLQLAAAFGFFAVLVWNIYAYGRFGPVEWHPTLAVPMTVGAVVLGGGLMSSLSAGVRQSRRKLAERNAEAAARGEAVELPPSERRGWFGDHGPLMGLVIIAGSLLLGALTALCWALTANALLDDSPPAYRPVTINRMVVTTHGGFLFREYEIEFSFADDPAGETHTHMSWPAEMARLPPAGPAVAEVHAGRFGWPWVKALAPAGPAAP